MPVISDDCVYLLKLVVGSLASNWYMGTSLRQEVFAFIEKTVHRIVRSNTYNAEEALIRLEYTGLSLSAEYCDSVRQQYELYYKTFSMFSDYLKNLQRYFLPISLTFGTACNILYIIINYRLWQRMRVINHLEWQH